MQQTAEGRQNPTSSSPASAETAPLEPGGQGAARGPRLVSTHIPVTSREVLTALGTAGGPLATVTCSCIPGQGGSPQRGGRLV